MFRDAASYMTVVEDDDGDDDEEAAATTENNNCLNDDTGQISCATDYENKYLVITKRTNEDETFADSTNIDLRKIIYVLNPVISYLSTTTTNNEKKFIGKLLDIFWRSVVWPNVFDKSEICFLQDLLSLDNIDFIFKYGNTMYYFDNYFNGGGSGETTTEKIISTNYLLRSILENSNDGNFINTQMQSILCKTLLPLSPQQQEIKFKRIVQNNNSVILSKTQVNKLFEGKIEICKFNDLLYNNVIEKFESNERSECRFKIFALETAYAELSILDYKLFGSQCQQQQRR